MFYCDPCRQGRNWPEGFSRSYGKCETCGTVESCYDVPSSALPIPMLKPIEHFNVPGIVPVGVLPEMIADWGGIHRAEEDGRVLKIFIDKQSTRRWTDGTVKHEVVRAGRPWVYRVTVPPEVTGKFLNALRELHPDLLDDEHLVVLKKGEDTKVPKRRRPRDDEEE